MVGSSNEEMVENIIGSLLHNGSLVDAGGNPGATKAFLAFERMATSSLYIVSLMEFFSSFGSKVRSIILVR